MKDDKELILQLKKGDLHAWGVLYDRYHVAVYRTALAITGDSDVAADMVQDTFLRLHRYILKVDANRPVKPLLYRIAANLSYTWVKRYSRWVQPWEDLADWIINRKRSPLQQLEEQDEWDIVRKAIMSLSVEHRVVVVLYYVNDLSLQEIADILSIPVGTVKSRLYYGREALKKHLVADGEVTLREISYEYT